jgi:hypothetical protein
MGMLQIGIRDNEKNFLCDMLATMVAGYVTNWYQSPTFNTEPAWAI